MGSATLRIGLAAVTNAPSIDERLETVRRFLGDARAQGAAIVCFPETYIPGLRGCDFPVPEPDQRRQEKALAEVRAAAEADYRRKPEDIERLPESEKLRMAEAFFGGSHELIIARRHYREGAGYDVELASSGEMTPEEHFHYTRATINAIQDIYVQNRYVRYVVTFQNWLRPAGASFDHLHKQLVGLDAWGTFVEREAQVVRGNKNVYNEDVVNFAGISLG